MSTSKISARDFPPAGARISRLTKNARLADPAGGKPIDLADARLLTQRDY